MKRNSFFALGLVSFVGIVPLAAQGCSDDVTATDASTTPSATSTGTTEPTTTTTSTTTSTPDSSVDSGPVSCTQALANQLKPINKVSTGEVITLEDADAGNGTLVFIDATAGGSAAAATNPRVYINLGTAKRVDVTDPAAASSTDWDVALKRATLFTNSGHGGPGTGSAVYVAKPFADVTAADATGKAFPAETFVSPSCAPLVDQIGGIKSTFDGWYDYDQATNKVTPRSGTFLVKGGKGALYKVAITQYYAAADGGGPTAAGANYVVRIGAL